MAFEVKSVHPEYHKHKRLWQQIKDQLDGEEVIKAKGELYLPFPVSLPDEVRQSKDFIQQYKIYLFGAAYVNYTQQAVEDLVSSVFSRDPIIDDAFPTDLEYLDLSDVARTLTVNLVSYGHSLLLVDYPIVDGEMTKERENKDSIAAYYTIYEALDILDWKFTRSGGKKVLTMVKVKELIINDDGEYEDQFRVLEILEGIYTITIYNNDEAMVGEPNVPKANGAILDKIPGTFVGVVSNDGTIDKPPIQGIANTGLKHYQNTAELQHSINYVGHPMLSITGAPMGFIDKMNEPNEDGSTGRITIGASNSLVIEGETGTAELLQISSDLVHFKQLEQLEKSMGEQGYRIKSDKAGVESAKSLTIRNSGNTSKLSSIATQVERAIKESMEFVNAFMNSSVPDDFTFDLVKNYLQLEADSNMINTLNGLVNSGRLPDYVLFDYLVEVELIAEDKEYQELRDDSEELDLGMDFDEGGKGAADNQQDS